MKTTKELIIADITAKVEAKLASQKVELGLIDDLNNALFKVPKDVELSKMEVELSNINELKAMIESNKGEVKNFEQVKKEIEIVNRRIVVSSEQTKQSLKKTAKVLDEFNKKASNLGLNARDVKEYVDLSKSFSELNTIVSEYTKLK